jgi:FkbH-like protein
MKSGTTSAGIRSELDRNPVMADAKLARSVLHMLRERSGLHPERTAFRYLREGESEEAAITYGDLDTRSRAIGARIQEVCPQGSRALVLFPSGIEYICAFLGCLYAGVIAVPCSPARSSRRIEKLSGIVWDCEPALCLTDNSALLSRTLSSNAAGLNKLAYLDTRLITSGASGSWREPEIDRSTVALLQYTSGSTSSPRGVIITHGNLIAAEQMIQSAFDQSEESVVVGWLPLYHDMGLIGNVLQPLYSGACSVLMSPDAFLQRPMRWLEAVSRYRGTTSGGPDFGYRLCIDSAGQGKPESLDLSCWTVAFNGSEPVRAETLVRFVDSFAEFGFSREAFVPCYGLAEATLFVSGIKSAGVPKIHRIDAESFKKNIVRTPAADAVSGSRALVSCGPPGDSQKVMVVDPGSGRRCRADEVGEIWISGPNVAEGYYGKPEDSSAVFEARIEGDPGRYLRTGDRGFLHAGHLYITGRIKDTIIIRGENHYPQDIELTITGSSPELEKNRAATFALDHDEEYIVVVVEAAKGMKQTDFTRLASRAREVVLKEHGISIQEMVFVKKGSIPHTSSGKVQRYLCRSRLAAGELEMLGRDVLKCCSDQDRSKEALTVTPGGTDPATAHAAVEELLLSEIGRISGLDCRRITVDTSVAASGLDSLGVALLKTSIEDRFGVSVSINELADAASIRILAATIVRACGRSMQHDLSDAAKPQPASRQVRWDRELPLSPEQERIWLVEQLVGARPSCNISVAVRLGAVSDRSRLEKAVYRLAERHPQLRAVFAEGQNGPVQKITEISNVPVPWEARQVTDSRERTSALEEALEAERKAPFDLVSGPLVRFRVLVFGEGDHVLLMSTHHIVADIWSIAILVRDLEALYEFDGSVSGVLPRLELDYLDFAQSQRKHVIEKRTDDYWSDQLRGATYRSYLESPGQEEPAGRASFSMAEELVLELKEKCREAGDTTFIWLLTSCIALLANLTNQREMVIAVPVWGRNSPGTSNVVGLFAFPLLVRVVVDSQSTFHALLGLVRKQVSGALSHQEIPFGRLLQKMQLRRAERSPLRIPILFSMLPPLSLSRGGGSLPWEPEALDGGDQGVEFLIAIREQRNAVHGRICFDTKLLDQAGASDVVSAYCDMVRTLVKSGDTSIYSTQASLSRLWRRGNRPARSLVIASTFTAEPLGEILRFWATQLGISLRVSFSPSGQVLQELLDSESALARNGDGANLILVRLSDWVIETRPPDDERNSSTSRLDDTTISQFVEGIRISTSRSSAQHIVSLLPSGPGLCEREGDMSLEESVREKLCEIPGVIVLTAKDVNKSYEVNDWHDGAAEEVGNIPFTQLYFAALGTAIVRRLYSLYGPRCKVIVVDCDQTLWSGVCGEDGWEGIVVDEGRRWFQEFLIDQQSRGVLLCLCSKNNQEDVAAVFERRTDMPLKRAHFAAERVNWQEKSANIRELSAELALGLDSFVFIDDDPVECAAVRINCPSVLTIELPSPSSTIAEYFSRIWAFDPRQTLAEDGSRPAFYQQEHERRKQRESALTVLDFIKTLAVRVEITELASQDLPRASELTFRANQFNATGMRLSEAELRSWVRPDVHKGCLVAKVSDRFGNYGLVGVLIYRILERRLVVDGWVLSCRALGRGVEESIITHLGQLASKNSLDQISLCYRPTPKNLAAMKFFQAIKHREPGRESDDQFVFVLQTQEAMNCLQDAQDRWRRRPETANPSAVQQEVAPAGREFGGGDLARIARELYEPRQILAALRASVPDVRSPGGPEPQGTIEKALAEIWTELLGVDSPSRRDSFFALGGDSILAVRLLSEIRRRLSVNVQPSVFFSGDLTISALAEAIEDLEATEAGSSQVIRLERQQTSP